MKALSFLLPALWVLVPVVCAQQTSTKNTSPTGIMTVAKYETLTALLNKDNPQKVLSTSVKKILDPYENGKRSNLIRATYNTVIGPPPPGPQLPYVCPEEADNYLKSLFFDKDLMNEIKALPHWQKQKLWDDILKKIGIILAANTEYIEVNSILKQSSKKIQHTADSTCFNHKPEDGHKLQMLIINFDTMAKKERWCFEDGGLKSSDASLRTTLVHEMGHQYVLANYPDLHKHHSDPNQSDPELVDKLVIMCQEAFAVYTEYQYLKHLAENSKMKSGVTFDFKNFLDDTYNLAQAVLAGDKTHQSLYNVDLAYMYYFLCGLNWDGKPDESGCPPFNYLQLEKIAKLCRLMRENKLDTSNIPPLKIDEDPFLIELNMSYASSNTQLLATYAELEKRIAHIFSSQKEILTRFLPKNAEAIRQQLASNIKIKSPADLQAIVNLTSQIPDNKPAHMTDEEYTIYLQEEYKKVSPDIRKQTFQVMLEYLSANQYMK